METNLQRYYDAWLQVMRNHLAGKHITVEDLGQLIGYGRMLEVISEPDSECTCTDTEFGDYSDNCPVPWHYEEDSE